MQSKIETIYSDWESVIDVVPELLQKEFKGAKAGEKDFNNTPLTGFLARRIVHIPRRPMNPEMYRLNYKTLATKDVLTVLEGLSVLAESSEDIKRLLTTPDLPDLDNPELKRRDGPLRTTPLMLAVIAGDVDAVNLLLPHYSLGDLLRTTSGGNNVLHLALISGQREVLVALRYRALELGVCWDALMWQKNACAFTPSELLNLLIGWEYSPPTPEKLGLFINSYFGAGEINRDRIDVANTYRSVQSFYDTELSYDIGILLAKAQPDSLEYKSLLGSATSAEKLQLARDTKSSSQKFGYSGPEFRSIDYSIADYPDYPIADYPDYSIADYPIARYTKSSSQKFGYSGPVFRYPTEEEQLAWAMRESSGVSSAASAASADEPTTLTEEEQLALAMRRSLRESPDMGGPSGDSGTASLLGHFGLMQPPPPGDPKDDTEKVFDLTM